MGLCKCPQRQVTNQFCFEHRVNVCEHCLVLNHPKCIVQSYLQWLEDSDYVSQCTLCYKDLDEQECVRLVCYHIFHWNCLNTRQSQLPANTAPAGHQCPVCEREIFPANNLVSPVGDALKEQLATTEWGRNGLGLTLEYSSNQQATSSIANSANIAKAASSTTVNTTSKIHHNHNEHSKVNSDFPYTTLKHDNPHSVLLIDAFTPPSSIEKYTSSRRPLIPRQNPIGGTDRDENKYARRTLPEMFSRWSRRFYAPSSRPPWRRTWFMIIIGIVAFVILIYIMAIFGRSDNQSLLDDGWGNPNPQPAENAHYD